MAPKERSHQFTHSNAQKRASIVYGSGSVGKGGLYLPQDFIHSNYSNEALVMDNDEQDDETGPLLSRNSISRRKSSVAQEILSEERTLLKQHKINFQTDDEDILDTFENAIVQKKIEGTTASIELKSLFKSSVPLVLTFLLQNSFSTISVFSVGHLGATELAAVSMGAMSANITGYATIQGIATALDTLCPQAFGAKRYHMVGHYLQKCVALIFVVMTPVLFIWLFYGYQLICFLLPDKETAKYAAVYLQYLAPGIPAYILFECGKRFLQAQGIYNISTYVLLVTAPSNAILNIILVRMFGYLGAPMAVAITYWLMLLGLYVSTVYFLKPESTPTGIAPLKCWGGLKIKEAFREWRKLAQLAVPGLIMLEAEFLAFEILTLLASYLGTVQLAAQSIGTTMASLTYQVPFAIGIASSTRIANYLGAGLAGPAKKATQVSLSFGLFVSIFNFLILYLFQTQIAKAFTNDQEVIDIVKSVMWLISLMQVSDAMNANSAGCLRGQGQTKIGGIVNLLSYYVVGLPLSIYLSFYSKFSGSLHGLWIGSCVALTIIGSVQSYFSLFTDFDKLCDDARSRISSKGQSYHV